MRIPEISLSNMGITNTDVSTADSAKEAINQIKDGLQCIYRMYEADWEPTRTD